ncbi:MAG: hypothetical protein AUJ51_12565 [Elusimicrobia bacterium CG1_02_56_21]|nr:MAG: hypothetical protein AUJ51_12565 [Elusimicrobia bacterium CG1_02_56_21]
MLKVSGFVAAAAVIIVLSGPAGAENNVLLALNTPSESCVDSGACPGSVARDIPRILSANEQPGVLSDSQLPVLTGLQASATEQLKAGIPGYTDFDALSSVNDPLYREGSRELLKEVIRADKLKKNAAPETLRDAPVSKSPAVRVKGRPSFKKTRSAKPLHSDPVKVKNTF